MRQNHFRIPNEQKFAALLVSKCQEWSPEFGSVARLRRDRLPAWDLIHLLGFWKMTGYIHWCFHTSLPHGVFAKQSTLRPDRPVHVRHRVLVLAVSGVQHGFSSHVNDQDLILSEIQHQEVISQYGDGRKGPNRH